MKKIKEYLEIIKTGINPQDHPNTEFHHFSIPAFDLNNGPIKEKGSDIKSNKTVVHDNTLLISKLNPHLLRIWKISECPKDSICSTEFVVLKFIRKDDEKLIDFFNALFYSTKFKNFLTSNTTGTSNSHQRVRPQDLLEFEFNSLSEEEMLKVGKIFSYINNKLYLNNKIVKKIEEIGDALFHINFFSQKRERVMLSDYVDIIKGCSYRSSELQETKEGLVNLKCISLNGRFNINGVRGYIGKYKKEQIITSGEVIISNTDLTQKAEILGRPALVVPILGYTQLIASLDLSIIRPKEPLTNLFVYFLLRSKDFQNKIKGYANGTTVLHLSKKGIENYEFARPKNDLIENFNHILFPLYQLAQNIEIENQILPKLRDRTVFNLLN